MKCANVFSSILLLTMVFGSCSAEHLPGEEIEAPKTEEQKDQFAQNYIETERRLQEKGYNQERLQDVDSQVNQLQYKLKRAEGTAAETRIQETLDDLQEYKRRKDLVGEDEALQGKIEAKKQQAYTELVKPEEAQKGPELTMTQRWAKRFETWGRQIEAKVNQFFDWKQSEKAARKKLDTLYDDLDRYVDKARNNKALARLQENEVEQIRQHLKSSEIINNIDTVQQKGEILNKVVSSISDARKALITTPGK